MGICHISMSTNISRIRTWNWHFQTPDDVKNALNNFTRCVAMFSVEHLEALSNVQTKCMQCTGAWFYHLRKTFPVSVCRHGTHECVCIYIYVCGCKREKQWIRLKFQSMIVLSEMIILCCKSQKHLGFVSVY